MGGKRKAYILLLSLALLLSACGGGARATTMRLRKTEGEVWVSDEKAKDVPLAEELSLYSGYRVDTWSESYAWIDLDEVKLAKMDQDTQAEITKDGKELEISVSSGSLFFHVTEPLEEDETMTIRTADLLVGIRGTCGWVDGSKNVVALLEGKVRCETEDGEKASVSAGEKAVVDESGQLTVTPLTVRDIPEFVREELEDDKELAPLLEELPEENGEAGDGDTAGSEETPQEPAEEPLTVEPWQDAYAAVLSAIRAQNTGDPSLEIDATSYQLYDIDKDGTPELIVEYGVSEAGRHASIYTYQDGTVVDLTDDGDDYPGIGMGHSYFYTWPEENGILYYGGHMGGVWASVMQLENGQLSGYGLLDEYIENPDEEPYPDIESVAPGTQEVDSFRIDIDLPIYRYRQTGQDLASRRSIQRGNMDNAAVRAKLLDVMQNNGMVHASVSDAYADGEGYMTFQEYLGPAGVDEYSKYPMVVEKRAWVDVNGDGQVECVLHLVRDARESYASETYAVMSLQGEEVYVYGWSYFSGDVLADGVFAMTAYDDAGTRIRGERLMFDGEECYQYTADVAPGVPEASWETPAD